MATYDTVLYGVAQFRVLILCEDPIDAAVEVLQVNPSGIHLKIHLTMFVPVLDMVSSFCPHSV